MKQKKTRKMSIRALKKVRLQVKQALIKRGSKKNHKPSVAQAQSWFNVLNKALFDERLKMPSMDIKQLKNAMGECTCIWDARKIKCPKNELPVDHVDSEDVKFSITLRTKFDTWKDFIETLAHEMVHLHQMTIDRDPTSNHNANFYKWRPKFKKFNLALSL
jgi:hypothetical protein